MAKAAIAKSRRRAKPLYFSAKISDYQFKKVLWQFVLDHSAAEAAKHVNLSANSITAIYAKLRKFFFDYRLFRDPYKGGDPRNGFAEEGYEDIEHLILAYHLNRVTKKHGALDCRMDEPDYHFAESNWRFDHHDMMKERGPELVQRMMLECLMAFIRKFGPVGAKEAATVQDRIAGLKLAIEQLDQRALWLERNSVKFNTIEKRKILNYLRID